MQDISLHIEYLLRYHDCVIVPGIGAFLRSRNAAAIDEATGTLSPAHEFICFNASIVSDDGLLAHSLSRRQEISFEQARAEVADTAEAIKLSLLEDGEIRMGRIGALHRDENGVISFTPSFSRNYSLPLIAPHSAKQTIEKEEVKQVIRPSYYTLRIPRRVVRYAAMLALVLVGAISLSLPSSYQAGHADQASVLPLPKVEKAQPVANEAEEAQEVTVAQAASRYYLIVGASASQAKCDEFISQHSHFALSKINSGSKQELIYVKASDNREELVQAMRSDEIKSEFGQTWIFDSAAN